MSRNEYTFSFGHTILLKSAQRRLKQFHIPVVAVVVVVGGGNDRIEIFIRKRTVASR